MASFRPRNRLANASASIVSGSAPGPANPSPFRKSRKSSLPNRRGSTNRNSRPLASVRRTCVCFATGASAVVTSKRPVIPRCTIHCATISSVFWCDLLFSAPSPERWPSSITMCLPVRWTATINRSRNPAACLEGGVLNGSRCEPNHTSTIRSPRTRASTPRAIVSTSGSSGIDLF